MAVVAVGDFDKAAIQKLIDKHFATLPASTNPRPRTTYDVPDRADTSFAILTDKETANTSVEFSTLLPAEEEGTIGVYRQKTIDRLFSGMLNARFSEMTQKPDAQYLIGLTGSGDSLGRTKEIAILSAVVKDDSDERRLRALRTEAKRVALFGFTETELARQKTEILR